MEIPHSMTEERRVETEDTVITEKITMKIRIIIIPAVLQVNALKQLHLNHMGMKKTRLLASDSIYWINMNADIEDMVKIAPTSSISNQHNHKL